jgi:serine/threonine protein kinase
MIDFGLATKLNPDEVVKVTTATAEFAAPEIVDREPVGFYTDMWAVGVLAYVYKKTIQIQNVVIYFKNRNLS